MLCAKFNIVWQTLRGFVKTLDWQKIGEAIGDAIMSAIHNIDIQARAEAISGFLKGLWKMFMGFIKKFNAYEFAETLFRKLTNAVLSINWAELGINIIKGIIVGLWNMFMSLIGAINGIIHGFIDKVKELFGIQSPSTVMQGIGVNIIQGLILGLQQT